MSDVFNWRLPPAPGYPGYQPSPQAPQAPRPAPMQIPNPPPNGRGVIPNPPPSGPGVVSDPDTDTEPYIPSRADRPWHQWGTPDFALQGALNFPGVARGPLMPQMRDIAGLIHAATMGLGRYGSRYTGMPAIAMGTYASAYWNAYQKGMHQRAGDAYQQYRTARQMTIDRGKEEMKDYAAIYATYFKDGKITDEDGFKNDLLQAATKYHNQPLLNAIQSGNLGAAERILQMTDAQIANLIKAQHQEERQKLQDELLKKRLRGEELPPEWGGGGGGGEPNSSIEPEAEPEANAESDDGSESDDDTESNAGAGAAGGTAAERTPPTRLAEADTGTKTDVGGGGGGGGGIRGDSGRVSQATPHVSTPQEVDQKIDDLAKGALRGEALPKGIPKQIEARISARQAALEKQLNDIVNSGATGQDMMDKVRAFDPTTARELEDVITGKRVVPTAGGLGAGAAPLWSRITSLATSVRPDWGPEISGFRKEFISQNGATQKSLDAANSMTGAARKVLEALQYIGENETPPENWFQQIISKSFTGDPRWNRLGSALNSYVEESAKLARGGQSAEGDISRVLNNYAPKTMGPKSIRALLANEAGVAVSQIQSKVDKWHSITWEKTAPPGYNPKAMDYLTALDHLDMMTGQVVPKDIPVPADLKPLLGKSGTRAGEITNSEQIEAARRWLDDPKNADDPRRSKVEDRIKELSRGP